MVTFTRACPACGYSWLAVRWVPGRKAWFSKRYIGEHMRARCAMCGWRGSMGLASQVKREDK